MKHAVSNREFGEVRTVIVLGVGRGGTSLVGGCLRALGLCMGTDPHALKHEWSPVVYGADGKIDLATTTRAIREMDATHAKWGWKSPRDVFQLEVLLPLLRAPGFVFVTRDLLEASLSGLSYQDVPLFISLDETALVYRAITMRLRYWPWPTLALPFADALKQPRELVQLLCSFAALEPSAEAMEQAISFVQPGTNAYRLFNARPGDEPALISEEDIRNDSEVLAADYSRRYGEEYSRQFTTIMKDAQTIAARLQACPSISSETLASKLAPILETLGGCAKPESESILIRMKRAVGWKQPGPNQMDLVLQQIAIAADEAKARVAARKPSSGYNDLARFFRVLQVLIRVRHILQGELVSAQLSSQAGK